MNLLSTALPIIIAMALLTACTPIVELDGLGRYKRDYEANIVDEIKLAKVTCKTSECPENVGMLLIIEKKSVQETTMFTCTTFLVAENILATNSHCIPDHIRPGDDCSEVMAAKFYERAGAEDIIRCGTLITKSELSEEQRNLPDYAFLRIERATRQPIEIAQTGITDDMDLRIIKANPVDAPFGAEIEEIPCVALHATTSARSIDPYGSYMALACKIKSGNSGSTVLDKRGRAVAIAYASVLDPSKESLKTMERVYVLPPRFDALTLVTNLACVAHPITGQLAKKECENAEDYDHSLISGKQLSRTLLQIFEKEQSLLTKQGLLLVPSLEFGNWPRLKVSFKPLCIEPAHAFSPLFAHWTTWFELDQRLHLSRRRQIDGEKLSPIVGRGERATLRLHSDGQSSWSGHVKIEGSSASELVTLELCTPEDMQRHTETIETIKGLTTPFVML